jgi:hypothetical protein
VRPLSLAAFLFESLIAPEFEARSALGFSAAETGTLQIVGPTPDMRAEFFVHVLFDVRAIEEGGDEGAK